MIEKIKKHLENKDYFIGSYETQIINDIYEFISEKQVFTKSTGVVHIVRQRKNNSLLKFNWELLKNIGDSLLVPTKLLKKNTLTSAKVAFNVSKFKRNNPNHKVTSTTTDEGIYITLTHK